MRPLSLTVKCNQTLQVKVIGQNFYRENCDASQFFTMKVLSNDFNL